MTTGSGLDQSLAYGNSARNATALRTTVVLIMMFMFAILAVWAITSGMLLSVFNTIVCHQKLLFQEVEIKREAVQLES